jgi:hypothetical protein
MNQLQKQRDIKLEKTAKRKEAENKRVNEQKTDQIRKGPDGSSSSSTSSSSSSSMIQNMNDDRDDSIQGVVSIINNSIDNCNHANNINTYYNKNRFFHRTTNKKPVRGFVKKSFFKTHRRNKNNIFNRPRLTIHNRIRSPNTSYPTRRRINNFDRQRYNIYHTKRRFVNKNTEYANHYHRNNQQWNFQRYRRRNFRHNNSYKYINGERKNGGFGRGRREQD